jgi:hypothetical protein
MSGELLPCWAWFGRVWRSTSAGGKDCMP